MPRGGRRQGTPGKTYQNRTDLQLGPKQMPIEVATGKAYGESKRQEDLQKAVPIQAAPRIPFAAPTQYPGEPLTTGLDIGPGPDSSILGTALGTGQEDPNEELRAIYKMFPSEDLRELLED